MRKTNEQTLQEVINEILDAYQLRQKMAEAKLIGSWEKLMGNTIARRTEEIYIKDRKLFLKVSSASLKQELLFARTTIMETLNKEAGEKVVDEVVIL